MGYPSIIQGGMGAGISNWRLARAVAQQGQLGVVSGTALDVILARRLQDGDPGGHVRESLERFPFPQIAERILRRYYITGGRSAQAAYQSRPDHTIDGPREVRELCMAANFVEVDLARHGHDHPIGINYLEKIQPPHLASAYGAMLAGVEYVLVGAGIPLKFPGMLDSLAQHGAATYPLTVAGGADAGARLMHFDPRDYLERELPPLKRPQFLAIISSNTLATSLVKKANGRVDGFVVEGPTAGGHNAPPRGKLELSASGEPVYGERDRVDLGKLRELGLPFWLAGGYGYPDKLSEARAAGAAGIQVGTAFEFCVESGLRDDYKQALLDRVLSGTARVFTDPVASPTGFPFKVACLPETVSEEEIFAARPRICDQGFLREAYVTDSGEIAFRCAAEPVTTYVDKGGVAEDAAGRKCLCNALLANIGQAQVRAGKHIEPGMVTSGDSLPDLARILSLRRSPDGRVNYSARDVIAQLTRS